MIYVILGKSLSGKTSIAKELVKRGVGKQITTTTTRPIRKNEVDGKDYYFSNERAFAIIEEENKLISIFEAENGWKYGININELDTNNDLIVVLEPNGYEQLINHLGKDYVKSIYINSSYPTRMVRSIKRGDDFKEVLRRAESDERDFEGIENKVDLIIRNDFDYISSIKNVCDQVEEILV